MPVPGAPQAPMLTAVSPSSVIADRAGFAAANPAVQSWSVRWRRAADPTATPPVTAGQWQSRTGLDVDTRSVTITDLAADTLIDAQIRAINTDGNSGWSDSAQTRTQQEDDMADLLLDLTEIQAGLESTPGTLVAATRKLPFVTAGFTPERTQEDLVERGLVRARTGFVTTGRGSELTLEEHLSAETLLLPLLCGWANVSSVAASGARRWTVAPSVTAPTGLSTATFEVALSDGGSDNFRRRFGFARPTELSISIDGESTAKMSTTWMGRAAQPLTSPAAVTAPQRWFVPARLFELAIDDTWAALGTSQIGKVQSMTLTLDPGLAGFSGAQGREDLDMSHWLRNRLMGSLEISVLHDGDTTTELAHWEAGDTRYLRLAASNNQSGAAARSVQFDLVGRWIESPDVLEAADDQHVLTLTAELIADSDDRFAAVEVLTGLTSW